jgi:peptidoglycan/LPS O-acetylase OafA/YrhL
MAVATRQDRIPIDSGFDPHIETSKPIARSSLYIPSLDGIRAFAVVWVFLAHAGLAEWGVPGNLGVTVFFFLSGYLITTLLRIELDKTGGINLYAFYLRRMLRIFPPMYLVLSVASALCFVGVLEGSLQLDAVLAQYFHLSNYYIISDGWWDGRAPGTWVYWSLAVEEHFYLVFPMFYLALLRLVRSRGRQLAVLAGLCLAILAWRLLLVLWLDASKDRTYIATDTRVDSILFGCILAIYGNPALDTTRISSRWWKGFLMPLGVVGIVLSIVVRQPEFQETLRYTLQGLALFPLFVVAVRYPEWLPCRALNLGWIRFVGALSYSMYLMHPTILFGVHQWTSWHPILQGAFSFGLCLLFATGMYFGIEKPCAELRRRLSRAERRPRRDDADAPAHPPLPSPVPAMSPASSLSPASWAVETPLVPIQNQSSSTVGRPVGSS